MNHSVSQNPATYRLRIISGPQAGAEALVIEGEAVLGSHGACALVLADPAIAPRHCCVRIRDGVFRVIPLDGPVYLDGQAIPAEGVELAPFTPVLAGGTGFALAAAEATWPDVAPPAPPAPEPPEARGKVQADAVGPDSPAPGDDGTSDGGKAGAASPLGRWWRDLKRRPALLSVLVAVALLGLLGLVLVLGTASKPTGPVLDEQIREIKIYLKRAGVLDATVAKNKTGVVVNGVVDDDARGSEIREGVRDIAPTARVVLYTKAKILDGLMGELAQRQLRCKAAIDSRGTVSLSGWAWNATSLEQALESFRHNTPVEVAIDNNALTGEQVIAITSKEAEKEGLSGYLQLTARPVGVEVTGKLSPSQIADWERVKATVGKTLPDMPPFQVNIVTRYDDPRLAVVGTINIGHLHGLLMKDGTKYFEGSLLPNGWTLESVTAESVIITKDGRVVSYPVLRN